MWSGAQIFDTRCLIFIFIGHKVNDNTFYTTYVYMIHSGFNLLCVTSKEAYIHALHHTHTLKYLSWVYCVNNKYIKNKKNHWLHLVWESEMNVCCWKLSNQTLFKTQSSWSSHIRHVDNWGKSCVIHSLRDRLKKLFYVFSFTGGRRRKTEKKKTRETNGP